MAYATTTDLARFGLPSAALSGIATATQEAALDAASVFADSYLRSRYGTLPLTSYGVDLTQCVCALAAETLLTTRGFDATRANGDSVTLRADNARAWLRDVSAGRAAVSGGNTTATATPIARASTAPSTASSSEQGW